jgi:DHA2 family multidrug resistance protein
VVLVTIGFGSLSVVPEQGDRLDWFNSPVISTLALAAMVAIPLFLVNEVMVVMVKTPLMRLDLSNGATSPSPSSASCSSS